MKVTSASIDLTLSPSPVEALELRVQVTSQREATCDIGPIVDRATQVTALEHLKTLFIPSLQRLSLTVPNGLSEQETSLLVPFIEKLAVLAPAQFSAVRVKLTPRHSSGVGHPSIGLLLSLPTLVVLDCRSGSTTAWSQVVNLDSLHHLEELHLKSCPREPDERKLVVSRLPPRLKRFSIDVVESPHLVVGSNLRLTHFACFFGVFVTDNTLLKQVADAMPNLEAAVLNNVMIDMTNANDRSYSHFVTRCGRLAYLDVGKMYAWASQQPRAVEWPEHRGPLNVVHHHRTTGGDAFDHRPSARIVGTNVNVLETDEEKNTGRQAFLRPWVFDP